MLIFALRVRILYWAMAYLFVHRPIRLMDRQARRFWVEDHTVRSKILQSILILLLMWGWIDDLVISTANADPSDDVATSENDDYIPPTSVEKQERSFSRRAQAWEVSPREFVENTSVAVALNRRQAANHDLLGGNDSLSAFMFMSLQC